ncbi:hypothetical protein [Xanthocytophaga agilis]|nr:hypothetical protein [Xanthocytophaga agilis]
MRLKSFKKWSIAFISLFLCMYPYQDLESCADGDWDGWTLSRFFNPELTNQPFFEPLYFSFDRLYDDSWEESPAFRRSENLADWTTLTENKAKTNDIENLVYKASRKEIQAIKTYLSNPATPLSATLQNNSMVKYLVQKKDAATVDYLIFAKTCEPFALEGDDWTVETKQVNPQIIKLISKAEQTYQTEQNPFLKLRYAYQAIRLAHYVRSYAKAISLYDKLVAPLNTESPIKYWALGHKAGAIRRSGQNNALAAYLFSVVFDKSESKRINSYYSFSITNDADWQKVLSMCKSNHEKATLHFLRAIQPDNLKLEEMKNIYILDPTSEYLDILLVREINKYEVKKSMKSEDLNTFEKGSAGLKAFIFKVVSEGKNKNKALWTLALGYTDYLAGNAAEARKTFAQLPASSQTKEVKQQIETFELMIQLAELQKIDAVSEERLYQAIKKTKSEALQSLMVGVFARLYKKQGEAAKEFLSTNDLYTLRTSPNAQLIEQLLSFTDKANKTTYEKELLAKIDKTTPKDVLLEMKATFLLRADKLDEAEQIFSKLTYKYEDIEGIPTQDQLKDCHECVEGSSEHFSKLQLIQQIKALKKQAADTDKAKALDATYKLGTIYYNTTYFGFAWRAMDYYRPYGIPSVSADDYTDCSHALDYYSKAAELAKQVGNKELAAKSLFMAAKCEQNNYYLYKAPKPDSYYEGLPPSYAPADRKYFTQLKQQYAATQFYSKARQECFYLNHFTR